MVEINFFEKKARNVLPHLMGGLFVLGVLLIGFYFFLMHGLYARQDFQNMERIRQQSEDVALSREMQSLNWQIEQNWQAVSDLEASRYPVIFLTEDVANIIPDSEAAIIGFSLNSSEELVLELNQDLVQNSADLISRFENQPYVDFVLFDRLDSELEGEGHVIQLTLILDPITLREEAGR